MARKNFNPIKTKTKKRRNQQQQQQQKCIFIISKVDLRTCFYLQLTLSRICLYRIRLHKKAQLILFNHLTT